MTRTYSRRQPPHAGKAAPTRQSRSGRGRQTGARPTRTHRRRLVLGGVVAVALVALIGTMMWTARATSSADRRTAPDFTLADTSGGTVHLADYRGRTVVLYFSEGAGCQSCLYQMADIERHSGEFAAANVTVLPIVMNTAAQIRADMTANGVRTPFLLDDGRVSAAYGTLGKGMHAGLPGHSFVLIDADGIQRWYGEYPSMYLSPADLLDQVRSHLA